MVAIDPSSPFSGGAVLGDRVRMTDHYGDAGVYIRSLSTRGSHGGLSRAAREIVKLLEAFGHDVIIVETVGVGQTELAMMDVAHTTVVVTVPEGGDGIQMMKAGLNEIADIFVVNKADREGADRVKAELELNVHLRPAGGWRPPVLLTQAANDKGIDDWWRNWIAIWDYLRSQPDPAMESERRAHEFLEILAGQLEERALRALADGGAEELVDAVCAGRLNPYCAARKLIENREAMGALLSKSGGGLRLQWPRGKSTSRRLFAVGDIHGCPDELGALLKAIKPASGDTVIFVGDYVDRGPSAPRRHRQLIELKRQTCESVFLKGNHEDMMLSFLGLPGHYGESFLFNGGVATLRELRNRRDATSSARPAMTRSRAAAAAPSGILPQPGNQLSAAALSVRARGRDPPRQLDEQEVEDLLWIRQEFILNPHGLGHTVIFGHTPMREIMVDLPYKIGIDTGLVYGGKLSCVELTEGTLLSGRARQP